jgi:hypothetical protein
MHYESLESLHSVQFILETNAFKSIMEVIFSVCTERKILIPQSRIGLFKLLLIFMACTLLKGEARPN